MEHSHLWNSDLAPTTEADRTWRWYHFAALWVGMVIAVPSWMLAAGLIDQGLSAEQAVAVVFLGNVIILLPMLLIGHAGARYGIPFAVLARASFGTSGAKLPAVARALVACGWYGIQTWIGGEALVGLLSLVGGQDLRGAALPVVDIGLGQLMGFATFWLIQLFFVSKGLTTIRRLETWTAPIKIVVCIVLMVWAIDRADGLGPILDTPSAFAEGEVKSGMFWQVFPAILTAMVGFWGTLALNIPDFTRFARSQRDQIIGQAAGLPTTMSAIALVSVVTTSATVVIFGQAIWDPVALTSRMSGPFVLLGLLVISIDTVSCNIAANLVCSAYDFSSLWPARISYRKGAMITACISATIMPWKLLADTDGYIFIWLTGYSALLGPIAGILIADYWIVRRARLSVDDLYRTDGAYRYTNGWNKAALVAFCAGIAPNLPGFVRLFTAPTDEGAINLWSAIFSYAWFIGTGVALIAYIGLMALQPQSKGPEACGSHDEIEPD